MERKSGTSSLVCTIFLGGEPIGGLQDFSFTENFNTKQINSLGRAFSNTFIPGFFNGEIRAKKVFISDELLSSAILHHTTAGASAKKVNDGQFSLKDKSSINESFNYIAPDTKYDDIVYSLFYDFIIYNGENEIIAILQDCIIDQRTTSISLSNITLMEDVVFKYKSIKHGSGT